MTFHYCPLEKKVGYVRLVVVQPSQDRTAVVECTISHEELARAKYNALSYTWGSAKDKQHILLNGDIFPVTKNLFVALQCLRDVSEPLTLWIDAICINQEDVDERNHQVRQMVDVYKNAAQVWIWLGEDIEGLDAALRLMNHCESIMDKQEPEIDKIERLLYFAESDRRIDAWAALTRLLEQPWWSRIWVIQEAVFSKDSVVICGKHRFPWRLLQLFAETREIWDRITWSLLERERTFHSGHFVHASDRLDFICAVQKASPINKHSIMPLLRGVRASEATDARDRVFAMLGLLQNNAQLCDIDYRKSTSQVFVEAAAGIWRLTRSLHFLSWTYDTVTRNAPPEPSGLPSWTPSWSVFGKRLLELQSPRNSGFTRKSMDEVFAQIDEHEYTVRVLPKFGELLTEGGALSSKSVDELLAIADEATRPKPAPIYPNEAAFKRDVVNRAHYINTLAIGPGWKTSFTVEEPSDRVNFKHTSLYATTGKSFPGAAMNVRQGLLCVLGFPMAVLDNVSPPGTDAFPLDGPPSLWARTVLNRGFGLPIYNKTKNRRDNASSEHGDESEIALQWHPTFWRLIMADQWQGARLKRPDGSGKLVIPGAGTIPPSSIEELFKVREAVTSFSHQVAYRWRTIFTSRRSIGLAPLSARPGDVVFALFGCDVPYLIRKNAEGYLFLGECYVHASMDGEALQRGYIKPQMVKLI